MIYYDVGKRAIRSFKDYLLQKVYKNNVINPNMKKPDISKSNDAVNSSKDEKKTDEKS